MSTVPPVNAGSNIYANAASTASATTGPKALGQADFLQLLSTQFQNQDPMKPMDDTAFIAQMAQFTSLQQTQTLTQQMTQLRATQDLTTANSYIGRKATVDAGDGTTTAGNVTAVDASGASPMLIVNGSSYALSAVLRLEPGVVPNPAAATP
ncbi:MAG: flagellar hook capping FlgD N-terminal domain-containing protein [Opitutaceae bacterium]